MSRSILSSLLIVATVAASTAWAVPADSDFKRARKEGDLVLRGCALVPNATRAVITDRRFVSVRGTDALNRTDTFKLSGRFLLFACGTSDVDPTQTALFARVDELSPPVEFTFNRDDFPKIESKLRLACRSVQGWPSAFVYKTRGSDHFSPGDCRIGTAGLVILDGGSRPSSPCIEVLDSLGNVVAKLGAYYPAGSDYEYRAYACYACGSSTPYSGSTIADKARKNTGSSDIYIDTGSTCYGPINAASCKNSSSC